MATRMQESPVLRALRRAASEGLVATQVDATTYTVPSASDGEVEYTVKLHARGWIPNASFSCDCQGGSAGYWCKHAAKAVQAAGWIDITGEYIAG